MLASFNLKKEQLQKIDINRIRLIEWLPEREEIGDIVSLTRSIQSKGDVDVPIKVRKTPTGEYELIWGRRRLDAAKLAGLRKITCIVEDNISDEEVFRQHAIENLHRLEKNCIEEAEFFEAWRQRLNTTYESIAQKLGINEKYVYNRVALLSLPNKLREKIKKDPNRSFGVYHGLLLLKIKDKKLQEELGFEVIKEQMSTRELKVKIENLLKTSKKESLLSDEKFHDKKSLFAGPKFQSNSVYEFFDLTLPFSEKLVNPLFPPMRIKVKQNKRSNLIRKVQVLMFSTHTGTHMDSPHEFIKGGKRIEELPLERFIRRGVILNTPKHENEPIKISDVRENDVRILEKDMVLFYTGWAEKYGTERYLYHPYISEELASWLIKRKVDLIGIDTPTIEKPLHLRKNNFNYPLHRFLFENDVLIVEGLGDMQKLTGRRVTVYVMPIVFTGANSYPVKVLARVIK
mgnify:CR=1 FL=1